jgi:hypothetical protein
MVAPTLQDGQPPAIYGAQPAEQPEVHDVHEGHEPTVVDIPLAGQFAGTNSIGCTAGNWNGEPTSRDYHWQKDGEFVPMARDPEYIVTQDDNGHSFACQLIVANRYGSSLPALSDAVVAVYVPPEVAPPPPPPPPAPQPPNMVPEVAVDLNAPPPPPPPPQARLSESGAGYYRRG